MYQAKVLIKRRKSILDPQGKAVELSAKTLGMNNISKVRIDKEVRFFIDTPEEAAAYAQCDVFCKKLLANLIMEDYEIQIEKVNGAVPSVESAAIQEEKL